MGHRRRKTDKTEEELAAQRARRLQNRIARAILKEDDSGDDAIAIAVRTLRENAANEQERGATRNNAAATLLHTGLGAAGALAPKIDVDARSVQLSMADMLKMAEGSDADSRLSQPGIKGELPVLAERVSDTASPPSLGSADDHQEDEKGGSGHLTDDLDEVDALLDELQEDATEAPPLASETQTPRTTREDRTRQGKPKEGEGDPTEP